MTKKDNKRRLHGKTITILVILVLILAFSFYRSITIEKNKYPILNDKLNGNNISYLYEFYTSNEPLLTNRPYFGDENAQITMIVFADSSGDKSREFINEIFPIIKEEYIDTGKIKFYHKNNIDIIDYQEKEDHYKFAQALLCVNKLYPDQYWNYYFNSFNMKVQENIDLNNLDGQEILNCMETEIFEELKEDISEAQKFKIQGINPVIYIGVSERDYDMLVGVPSITKLRKAIRQKQLIIGD
jgi:protein-disulfide isomerase